MNLSPYQISAGFNLWYLMNFIIFYKPLVMDWSDLPECDDVFIQILDTISQIPSSAIFCLYLYLHLSYYECSYFPLCIRLIYSKNISITDYKNSLTGGFEPPTFRLTAECSTD